MISCCSRSISLSYFIIPNGFANSPYISWNWNPFKLYNNLPCSVLLLHLCEKVSLILIPSGMETHKGTLWWTILARFKPRHRPQFHNMEWCGTTWNSQNSLPIHPFVSTQPQHRYSWCDIAIILIPIFNMVCLYLSFVASVRWTAPHLFTFNSLQLLCLDDIKRLMELDQLLPPMTCGMVNKYTSQIYGKKTYFFYHEYAGDLLIFPTVYEWLEISCVGLAPFLGTFLGTQNQSSIFLWN